MKTHEYGDSYTGMLCGAMVVLPDGSGDQCGLHAGDPAHNEPWGREVVPWMMPSKPAEPGTNRVRLALLIIVAAAIIVAAEVGIFAMTGAATFHP